MAQEAGLSVPQDTRSPQAQAQHAQARAQQASITDVLEMAAKGYQQQLKASPRAVAYLKNRGLTGQIAKTYGMGYAPEGWRYLSTLLPDYQSALLTDSGLVIQKDDDNPDGDGKRYDRFRDRIMFPIRNVKGACIGFGGRVLDKGEPKYLNSPETPVFSKGHELYGLFEGRTAIRQAGYALVTEGYMDVVALAQHGFGHAVATLGTACTPDHVRLLFRFTDHVVFAFDGDAAGRRAAQKALSAALPWSTDTRSVKFLFLPSEHDPDSYVRSLGAEAFEQAIAQALPLSQYLLQVAADGCDLSTPEGRARLASQGKPLWQLMPDGALRRQLLDSFAEQVQLDARELADLWGLQTSAPRKRRADPPAPATSAPEWKAQRPALGRQSAAPVRARLARGVLSRADRVARLLIEHPQLWEQLSPHDHHVLSQQEAPHGPFFTWFESQALEHGPQPWAALKVAMTGQGFEAWLHGLMASDLSLDGPDEEPDSHAQALKDLLLRMHIDALNLRIQTLLTHIDASPDNMTLFKRLSEERKSLLQQLA